MNSCIYLCRLYHEREKPKINRFSYGVFIAYLDLDELTDMHKNLILFSHDRWNILSFHDDDHFKFLKQKGIKDKISQEKISYDKKRYVGKTTKQRIHTLIRELKLPFKPGKVFLLTNMRNFGYLFNPVSFYYCFDVEGRFRALFSEVNNTYHDQKMYYVLVDPKKKRFKDRQKKNFYVSPFIDYDTELVWDFTVPGKTLEMRVDSVKEEVVLKTSLGGRRMELSNLNIAYLLLRYPLMTMMIIVMIHYQALRLWLKGVPFHMKDETDRQIARTVR